MTKTKIKGIEVVDQFLADWKEKAYEYHWEQAVKYRAKYDAKRVEEKKLLVLIQAEGGFNYSRSSWSDERKAEMDAIQTAYRHYQNSLTLSQDNMYYKMAFLVKGDEDKKAEILNTVLDRDVKTKKVSLIVRIEKKAGDVVEAHLYVGVNGELNGTIEGVKSTVKITTIYAGGYNIQCLHYRVLIK